MTFDPLSPLAKRALRAITEASYVDFGDDAMALAQWCRELAYGVLWEDDDVVDTLIAQQKKGRERYGAESKKIGAADVF